MTFWSKKSKIFIISTCCLALCLQAGCKKKTALTDVYDTNIKKMHVCYETYMEGNGYQGPKDEEEFKNYLKTDPTAIYLLKRIDLNPSNIDDIFVSERDGEPFEIRYSVKGMGDHAVIFEKTGVDGKRYVALADPIELDATAYDGWFTGKTKPEMASGVAPSDEVAE